MTNPPPVLLASASSSPRRRVNGWELALWIAGVALLASACVFEVTFVAVAPSAPLEAHDAPVAANIAPIPAPATRAESTAPTDYAVFMRPSGNPADRPT